MTNYLYDRQKRVLTVLENLNTDQSTELVESHIAYILHRIKDTEVNKEEPFDKEKIILPRQKTYTQELKEKNKFRKTKRTRMIWDEQKKDWMLRRNKKKALIIPPIIEATRSDAYEDVFRKREMQAELDKSKLKLSKMKKHVKKAVAGPTKTKRIQKNKK